ncbi:MAG: hypothetical protein WC993_03580 [Methanoculleus sp.]
MTKVIRLNCKYCHASGLAGFFIRASDLGMGDPAHKRAPYAAPDPILGR